MRFKAGEDIEKIFNSLRPKYPIRKYISIFNKKILFKEEYLHLNEDGYIEHEFKELSIEEICKVTGINKKDIDEIVNKTNYNVEGAVAYFYNGNRVFRKGKHNSVSFTKEELIKMKSLIHSHPSGTSFSTKDVANLLIFNLDYIVAFNKKYFYILRNSSNSIAILDKIQKKVNETDLRLQRMVERGIINKSQKNFSLMHYVWKEIFKKGEYEFYKIKKS
jgi:NAD+--asparagine ADP-ribosyltransferase